MGWLCFLAPSGSGGEIPLKLQREVEKLLPQLCTYQGWNEAAQEYRFVHPEWYASMQFTSEGLRIWWDDYTPEWANDLLTLVTFGKQHGLGLFKDSMEEFEWEFIVWMLGQETKEFPGSDIQ